MKKIVGKAQFITMVLFWMMLIMHFTYLRLLIMLPLLEKTRKTPSITKFVLILRKVTLSSAAVCLLRSK